MNSRAIAATVIDRVIRGGAALDEPLAQALGRAPVETAPVGTAAVETAPVETAAVATADRRDRALVQQLAYGTLRQHYRLQGILDQVMARPLKAKDGDIRALLLCGLHQLLDMRTPDHAAISTTVEACRSLGKPWATGLVNGVLRRCRREAEQLEANLSASARLNHPAWLVEALQRAWPDHWRAVIDAGNCHPPMCLRVNQRQSTRDDYLASLAEAGLGASACRISPVGVRLAEPVDVERLPGFEIGRVSVQDEAAQLAAPLLQLQPGQRVLDACAAPGGKTCHILEIENTLADLVAADSSASRLERVRENLARLGLEAELAVGDARTPSKSLSAQGFDRILVDAPCSGTGVIRRHPDIKVLRKPGDIGGFADLQQAILAGLWPLLRPGGLLLYVTCSILPAENSEVIDRFLGTHDDAMTVELPVDWGLPLGAGRQLLPETAGADGLFFAQLLKSKA